MELYDILQFVHVIAAVLWVGGATVFHLLGERVAASDDPARIQSYLDDGEHLVGEHGAAQGDPDADEEQGTRAHERVPEVPLVTFRGTGEVEGVPLIAKAAQLAISTGISSSGSSCIGHGMSSLRRTPSRLSPAAVSSWMRRTSAIWPTSSTASSVNTCPPS